MDKWLPEIKQNANVESSELFLQFGKLPIMLIGTKADLRDDEAVQKKLQETNSQFITRDQIDQVVDKYGFLGYVECSAATQMGVREVFEKAVQYVVFEPERLRRTERVKAKELEEQKRKDQQKQHEKENKVPAKSKESSKQQQHPPPQKKINKPKTSSHTQHSTKSKKQGKSKKSSGDCIIL